MGTKHIKLDHKPLTERQKLIAPRFLSDANDITNVVYALRGRPPVIEPKLKANDKVWILEQLEKGITQKRILKDIEAETGLIISKASFCRLVRKLKKQ